MREAALRVELRHGDDEIMRRWFDDPRVFVREAIQAEPDPWQDDVLHAMATHRRVALKACVGPGKSTALAWGILWWVGTRPHAKAAATSITATNLRDNLWAELAKWMRQSPYLSSYFEWTASKLFAREAPEDWWCSARSWDRSADPDKQGQTLAGLHAVYPLAVADESGGMPDAVVDSASGVLSSPLGKLWQSGNPTNLAGPLHRATTKERYMWHVIEISGDPDDPNRAPRVDAQWAREQIASMGRDHPFVRSKILGKFPRQATDALVGLDHFEDAYGRTHTPDGTPLAVGLRTLGVDVARMGGDATVITRRDGDYHRGDIRLTGLDTEDVADAVAMAARELDADEIRVDVIGIGAGVVDKLRRRTDLRAKVYGVNVGQAPTSDGPDGEPLYANLRAQLAWELAERLRTGTIGLPPEMAGGSLEEQSTDMRYGFGRGGKVYQLEPKDEYRKRHRGASPDEFDAAMLAFGDGCRKQTPTSAVAAFYARRAAAVRADRSKAIA